MPVTSSLAALQAKWVKIRRHPGRLLLGPCRKLGEQVLHLGEPLLAHDIFRKSRLIWKEDVRLRQLDALALARAGVSDRARVILEDLRDNHHLDGETSGILARTYKDQGDRATCETEKRAAWAEARKLYQEAFTRTVGEGRLADSIYTGINAATMSLMMGEGSQARELATQVQGFCERCLAQGEDYWKLASLAEATLIIHGPERAFPLYQAAGLLSTTTLRMALHAGPVFRCVDPMSGGQNFYGHHVNKTARMETITPPGEVFASQEFAALAAAEEVESFICDYHGDRELPKDFGVYPTYHVRARGE